VGGDDQGRPAVPGFPPAVLVLVQAEAGFGGLEGFLDAPPSAGDGDELVQRNQFGAPVAVERLFTGGAVAGGSAASDDLGAGRRPVAG
jgi:hypothetical protein